MTRLKLLYAIWMLLISAALSVSAKTVSVTELRRSPLKYAGKIITVEGLVVSGEFHWLLRDRNQPKSVELQCPDGVKGVPRNEVVRDVHFVKLCESVGYEDPTVPTWKRLGQERYALTAVVLVKVEKCGDKPCIQKSLIGPLPVQVILLHVLKLVRGETSERPSKMPKPPDVHQ